jgi:hypothetical protein
MGSSIQTSTVIIDGENEIVVMTFEENLATVCATVS